MRDCYLWEIHSSEEYRVTVFRLEKCLGWNFGRCSGGRKRCECKKKPLTLFATHAHLAVLVLEATACVTHLDRKTRRPPPPRPWIAFHMKRGEPQIRHIGQMTNWPARAACYVKQQGNDKLARSSSALFGAAGQW